MKRFIALLLALAMMLTLCACGKKKKKEKTPEETVPAVATPVPNEPFEVKITLDNLYDWFDYKEFRADVKEENTGEVTSCTVNYGLQLKPAFTAANDPKHRDTMTIQFEAEGVVLSGDFQVDFTQERPSFSGTTATAEHTHVSEQLRFWPKGDRTTWWAFGNYSSSNIMYFESFTVTKASGSVWLKRAEAEATPTPIPTPWQAGQP